MHSACNQVQRESTQRFSQLESSLKSMTDLAFFHLMVSAFHVHRQEDYSRGTGEVHKQMRQQLGLSTSSASYKRFCERLCHGSRRSVSPQLCWVPPFREDYWVFVSLQRRQCHP